MKRKFIVFVTAPFVALGFVWQFIGGGFEAGRMLATMWVHDEALKSMANHLSKASGSADKSKLN